MYEVSLPSGIPDYFEKHITRSLSSMNGQFLDQQTYSEKLAREDPILYEVYEISRPEVAGEIIQGISILHPGKIGNEYYMTKGHFHTVLETAEVYYCLHGIGKMVMETKDGDWAVEDLVPGRFLYVPPIWAHRSVNISPDQDLISAFFYPGNAGHDYGTIETNGFRKLVAEVDGKACIVDNPRWKGS
jgi:glucose-6-phosphate isomerase